MGGYKLPHGGGEDWMASTTARMLGWKTKSFREKCSIHLRLSGAIRIENGCGWVSSSRPSVGVREDD